MLVATLAEQLQHSDYSITTLPDGSAVLLDLHQESVLTFNGTAAFIVSCIAEGVGEDVIAGRVVGKYEVDETTARHDVARFVRELAQAVGLDPA
jgi:hypothetical protein